MKYSQDNNAMFLRAEINTVRKMTGDDASYVFANNSKLEGAFGCK